MCYAIPGKVIELRNNLVVIDYFGERRNALNDLEDVKIGDYLYAQGGIVVQKIEKEDALAILDAWKERFFQLKKTDALISKIKGTDFANNEIKRILEKAKTGLSNEEMLRLIGCNERESNLLFKTANKTRQQVLGNSCCVHGIIEFSNHCRNDCLYCGIRKSSKLKRYRMQPNEIVKVAEHAVNVLGFKALVLQSGEDVWYTTERLVRLIKQIRKRCGVLLFMSVGERSFECYDEMYKAGARGILMRFETSNEGLYAKVHSGPKADFQKRISLLRYAGKLGYIIVTGSLIGLPLQTDEDIINDVLLTKSINAEMYSFGPLIPHPETPLGGSTLIDLNTVLKVIALTRILNPNAKILATTALETLDKDGLKSGLLSGANSLMINITPKRYKKLYYIYPDKAWTDITTETEINDKLNLLYSLGRAPTDIGI